MSLDKIFARLSERAPAAVMARALLSYAFEPDFLDKLFRQHAERQREGELLFSTGVALLTLAATRAKDSLHAAYQEAKEEVGVSFTSLCNKINGTDLAVISALVREPALRLQRVGQLLKVGEAVVRGFETTIIDGNHLASTDHRLKVLRNTRRGPLPGQSIVFFDADRRLFTDVVLCEDGHAQERRMFPEVVKLTCAGRLYMADRNFCTRGFLTGLRDRGAFFLIRQHGSLAVKQLAEPRYVGQSSTGRVFECQVQIGTDEEPLVVRQFTIRLNKPTQSGATEVQVLTNVTKRRGGAVQLADAYLKRWKIENAFNELERTLRSEINTLAYPPAALLAFSISLTLYNILSIAQQAIEAVHGEAGSTKKVSSYYLVSELTGMYQGLMVMTDPEDWAARYGTMTPRQMAATLRELASNAKLYRYEKHPRGPKKPKGPRKESGETNHHVSTAKRLAEAKE